jgi:uncharacterized protein (TIGR00661 family)
MKYFFIVQGEGRGHLTQAISLAEILRRNGHDVIEVLIGKSSNKEVPKFFYDRIKAPVATYDAPSFVMKKNNKHIDKFMTFVYNMNPLRLRIYGKGIEFIYRRIKAQNPDVVVNFYELLPGFVFLRFRLDIPFINIGHQYLLKHPDYQFGKGDSQNMMILRLHALLCGINASKLLALSFYPMRACKRDRLVVLPPLLRPEVLELKPYDGDYILGYMLNSGYLNEVQKWHKKNPDVKLHFFWDKKDVPEDMEIDNNLTLHCINDRKFLEYMKGSKGYITTAGFESVCEALFLNKKTMLIPAHIEQEINAADAASIHGGVIGESFDLTQLFDYMQEESKFNHEEYKKWILSAEELFIKELTTDL